MTSQHHPDINIVSADSGAGGIHMYRVAVWAVPTVKCPSKAHFKVLAGVVGHPGTFHLLFYKYFFSGTFIYCIAGKYAYLHAASDFEQIG